MKHVTHEDDLAPGVAPLSREEKLWIKSLERVFKKMPARLMLIEIGDVIQVVDREASRHVSLEDGKATAAGIMLCGVDYSAMVLNGVSG
jgi:hypothetical protein